jgi:MFS family permease
MMVIGYPLGGIVCGEVGKAMLEPGAVNFRVMFTTGAILSAAMIPVCYFLLPESVHWLTRKQPDNALARINAALTKIGQQTVSALPQLSGDALKKSVLDIFSPAMVATTLLATAAYFFHIITFYYVLKWTPTIVTTMGIPAAAASGVLTWANVGGALGGAMFGLLSIKIGIRPLSIGILLLTMVGVAVFGRSAPEVTQLSYLAAFAGFFGNAGVSGLYTIIAYVFPTHVRATGTGFVIGVGRGGAVLSPIIAGYLLNSGSSLPQVGMVMGFFSVLGAVALMFLKLGTNKPSDAPVTEAKATGNMKASAA